MKSNLRFLAMKIKEFYTIDMALEQFAGIKVKKKSRNSYSIKCIFHDDRSPSFAVYNNNHWVCFAGCGNGDVINLVSKLLNISDGQAILRLAKQLGISSNGFDDEEQTQWRNDIQLVTYIEKSRQRLIKELLRLKKLFEKAKEEYKDMDEAEDYAEQRHEESNFERLLELLYSDDYKIQVAVVKEYAPKYLGSEPDEL